jgi:cytochrome c553
MTFMKTLLSSCARALALTAAVLLASPATRAADDFEAELARVDKALATNPHRVPVAALQSCETRRNVAADLYARGHLVRAQRSLSYCKEILRLSDVQKAPAPAKGPSMEALQAQAAREVEKALRLTPDVGHGLEIYRSCAMCHKPEGWGLASGSVPQLAGQHRKVVIKQLADIRAGNRDALLMLPYASVESIGGAQAVADVAGYIDTLEISVDNGKGPGDDLELGEQIYTSECADCHGAKGEGDDDALVPRIQAQHYRYLLRQLDWIRNGKRRNANPEMETRIRNLDERETRAVLDYVSRLVPPAELQAPPGWKNPDFAH